MIPPRLRCFRLIRNKSLKVVNSNFFWRLFLLFPPSGRVPKRSPRIINAHSETPVDCLHDAWLLNPRPLSLCLALSSVLGQVQAWCVQPAGPVLPRPVPGRLLRAGQRQQLCGLQEPAARQQLRGDVSSWILRLQGLAVCQLFLLPGGWSLKTLKRRGEIWSGSIGGHPANTRQEYPFMLVFLHPVAQHRSCCRL